MYVHIRRNLYMFNLKSIEVCESEALSEGPQIGNDSIYVTDYIISSSRVNLLGTERPAVDRMGELTSAIQSLIMIDRLQQDKSDSVPV